MFVLLRTLAGLLLGTICGALIGAVGFAVADAFFSSGRHLSMFEIPLYVIGIVFVGVPGAVVGSIVGGSNLGFLSSASVGAAVGLLIVLLNVSQKTGSYLLPGSNFDWQFLFMDVVIYVTWICGLSTVGIIVSASVRGLLTTGK